MFYPVLTDNQSFFIEASKRLLNKSGTAAKKSLTDQVAKAIDRDIAKLFQYLAADIRTGKVREKVQYFAGGIQSWAKLNPAYARKKKRINASVKLPHYFFLTGGLAEDFANIPTAQVLKDLGKTKVSLVSQKKLDITVATKKKFPIRKAEKFLTFLNTEGFAGYKLDQGKKRKYRPLIGPYLQYYYNYQLLEVVRKALRSAK